MIEQIIVDLKDKESQISEIGTKVFDRIIGLPTDVRPADEKPRTGIQIYIRQPGTRNSAFVSVYSPSKDAMTFSVEKSVRTEMKGDWSSQNSAEPDIMRFAGCIVVIYNGIVYHCSVSGLKAPEDVATAVITLADVLGVSIEYVLECVKTNFGLLPEEFHTGHYLNQILDEYTTKIV